MARGWHGGAGYDWGGVVAGQSCPPLALTMDAGDTPSEVVASVYTGNSTTPVASLDVTITSGLVTVEPLAATTTALGPGMFRWALVADDVVWFSGSFEVHQVNSARSGSSSQRTVAVNVGTANTINVTIGTGIDSGILAVETAARIAADSALDTRLDAIEGLGSLATDAEVTNAVTAHAGATDPHGDRAAATAALDAHTGDTDAAHAASAISYAGSLGVSASTVEAAIDVMDPSYQYTGSTLTLPWSLGTLDLTPPAASASVQHFYVDYVAGSNAANGTSTATPVQYIETAAGKITAATGVIFVKGSAGPVRRIWAPTYTGKTIWVVPWPGETTWDYYASVQVTSGWTSVGAGVYSKTVALNSGAACTVTTLADANGNQTRLARNTSTPTTPAAGQFGYTGGVLYVRLPGDVDPGSHTIEAAHYADAAIVQGSSTYILVGCRARYAGGTGLLNGGSPGNTGSTMILIDCEASYNGGNGVGASVRPADTFCVRTVAYCNGDGTLTAQAGDGFNLGCDAGFARKMVLVDCQASYNSDEGASPHQDGTLYIFGGRLNHNRAGGYASVHRSVGHLVGVEIDHNHFGGSITGEAAIGVFDTSTCVVDGCAVHHNTAPAYAWASGAYVTVRRTTQGGNGTTVAALTA